MRLEMDIKYKVDINPSYEWSEKTGGLNVSHRELEVLALVVEGYKNKEIAQILEINHQSVKNHLQHLFKKLDVKNSTQAYIIALQMNLIKMRSTMPGYKDAPIAEITTETVIDIARKLISGESWVDGVTEKKKRLLIVWLKEHGIEPYNWDMKK